MVASVSFFGMLRVILTMVKMPKTKAIRPAKNLETNPSVPLQASCMAKQSAAEVAGNLSYILFLFKHNITRINWT